MVSEQLQKWVESTRAKGYSDEQIKQHMLSQGYAASLVDEALKPVQSTSSDEALLASISQEMNEKSTSSPSSHLSYHPKKKLNVKAILYLILIPLVGIGVYFFMTASSVVCDTNLACDDGISSTYDICISPGLESALCVNAPREELSTVTENTFTLSSQESISFVSANQNTVLLLDKVGATSVQATIFLPKQVLFIGLNRPTSVDINKDGIVDIQVTVQQLLENGARIALTPLN